MDLDVRLDYEIYFYHQADFICTHAMKLLESIPILVVHRTDIMDVLYFAFIRCKYEKASVEENVCSLQST
jgi:hypothetical protein